MCGTQSNAPQDKDGPEPQTRDLTRASGEGKWVLRTEKGAGNPPGVGVGGRLPGEGRSRIQRWLVVRGKVRNDLLGREKRE